ncbi:hypothetical protein GIB67_042059 [Kingdonia uniflora]|uniref:Uncharacterized protein n=1 Tax=Kingdonia uniflora TaxID=39325 RepID=A0A7J7MWB3_9MAGN|nr:hypothetical protein GIB67_042059 [Kingdonia uniflora]
MVFADLLVEPGQLLMVSVAVALKELGYAIQVYSLEDGSVHVVWRSIDIRITIFGNNNISDIAVNWLNYDSVLVSSLEARDIISCLVQEPVKSLPIIWIIHEKALAIR